MVTTCVAFPLNLVGALRLFSFIKHKLNFLYFFFGCLWKCTLCLFLIANYHKLLKTQTCYLTIWGVSEFTSCFVSSLPRMLETEIEAPAGAVISSEV